MDDTDWYDGDSTYEVDCFTFFGRWATGLSVMDGETITVTFREGGAPITIPVIPGVYYPFNLKTIHKSAEASGNPRGIIIYG